MTSASYGPRDNHQRYRQRYRCRKRSVEAGAEADVVSNIGIGIPMLRCVVHRIVVIVFVVSMLVVRTKAFRISSSLPQRQLQWQRQWGHRPTPRRSCSESDFCRGRGRGHGHGHGNGLDRGIQSFAPGTNHIHRARAADPTVHSALFARPNTQSSGETQTETEPELERMNSTEPENNASTVLVDEHDVAVAVDSVETTSVGASQTVLEKEGNATVPFFASVESRKKPSTPVSSGVGVVRDHHRDDCGETKHKQDETNISPASTSTSTSSTSKPAVEREGFQDRVLSRRNALRYGVAVTGAALITGLAHTQTSVEENLPPPPYRLSLWPKPVLPINNKNGPGEKQLPQQKQQQPKPQSQPQSQQKEAPSKTTATVSKTAPTPAPLPAKTPSPTVASPGRLDTVNLTKVVSETNINVTMACTDRCLSIDSSNFTFNKIETPKVPNWLPSFLAPKAQVVKQYSNSELLVAATAAGSICEMGRTSLLYPLSTIKTRIQADRNDAASGPTSLSNEVRTLGTNVRQKIADGDLWAGISPTLLVSVPATGIYYGVRDVTKRMLYMTPLDSTSIALGGALVGDVVSLCFRTPSNALAIRLQAQNETAGDWLGDSVRRLPMVILTDLPYLMSKIVLNKMFIRGSLPVSDYALYAILAAVVAGFLTTPFDVARTRILLDERLVIAEEDVEGDADADVDVFAYSNGREGIVDRPPTTLHPVSDSDSEQAKAKADADADAEHPTTPSIAITRPDYGLIQTMIQIANEGEGGVRNLFSGWLERVIYLGIGRAWLEPIQLIGYIGIRDAVLLQWF